MSKGTVEEAVIAMQQFHEKHYPKKIFLTKSTTKSFAALKEGFETLEKSKTKKLVTVHGQHGTYQAMREVGSDKEAGEKINADKFSEAASSVIKKHFPNSHASFQKVKMLGQETMVGTFTLGKPGEYENGIKHNDPMHHSFIIHEAIDKDGNFESPKIGLKATIGGIMISKAPEHKDSPHDAYGRVKLGWKNKTGTQKQILEHLDKYFANAKKLATENKTHLPRSAENL